MLFHYATLFSFLAALLVTYIMHASADASESTCLAFSTTIPGVSLARTTHFSANASIALNNDYSWLITASLPAFCRLELLVTTNETTGSFANTEVWLPDTWNGRMLTVGSGGLAGGANLATLGNQAVAQGFAGVSTNGGHNSSALDGEWGGPGDDVSLLNLNRTQAILKGTIENALVDWGWRAVHLSVLAGKAVVQQYYNQTLQKSYYFGCSTGGRQGLKEIQLFPDSFDGAVVGSPASWLSHLTSWGIRMSLDVLPTTSSRFIPERVWTDVIGPEVMRQCDALDGVLDRVINDPQACNFCPEALTCLPSQNTSTCLNVDQIAALRRIYADYYENGTYVFGGFNPGGEDAYFGSYFGGPSPLPTGWYKYMVLNDTEWTIDQYNSTLYKLASDINPGQADGGHGANAFGGMSQPPPIAHDADHDILAALIRWVEDGVAPEKIVAAKYKDDNVTAGVAFTRPLCKYPKAIRYTGGDPHYANSFACE
ncbi:tannase and feruloyl esterase-domain-containing protein [Trametes meyenii]|nr:tannase and feruloyl esterase-domain-containing protein [Trametes meyenii]